MTETEHPQSASPQPRVSWSLSIPSLIYQAYNRRSKRVIAGSAAIVLLVLLNMYLARNRGLELYHQLQEYVWSQIFSATLRGTSALLTTYCFLNIERRLVSGLRLHGIHLKKQSERFGSL